MSISTFRTKKEVQVQPDELGVAPSQDASDHQDHYIFNRESLLNLHFPLLQ